MSNKVLVTGGSGFIGSHLVENLLSKKYLVTVLVPYDINNSIGWLKSLKLKKKLKIVHGDVCDQSLIFRLVKKNNYVIHLAALISIPYSYQSPNSYVNTNILGTLNILEACRKYKVNRMLHTSTSEVYGSAQYTPIDEKHPLNAQSPYAATKVAADQLVLSYFRSFSLPVAIIRPFNTFGPRQSLRAVIPTIISQVLNGNLDIKLGNISTKRDFTHVKDTANGFVMALKAKNIDGEVINLGTGINFSIKNVIDIISKITKKKINIIVDKQRLRPTKSEVSNLLSNNKKAKKILKWKLNYPGKKGFERAMVDTIKWFSEPKNLKHYDPNKYTV